MIGDRYLAGETANAIAGDLGLPVITVGRTLDRVGVERRPDPRVRLPDRDRDAIAASCVSGTLMAEVAQDYGISVQTVGRILRERKIKLPNGKRRTCTLNDAAFDVLTPEVEYWLGFLFADGSLPQNNHGGQQPLAINLAARDVAQLEKLRTFLGSTHKISHIERPEQPFILVDGHEIYTGPVVSYRVRSNHIAETLRRWGMRGKSSGERVPVNVLARSRHFWRGCVDGDGWICTYKGEYAQTGLCGHIPLLEIFQTFLNEHDISLAITPTESGIFRITTIGHQAGNIIEILYRDTSLALDRKLFNARAAIRGAFAEMRPYNFSDTP